MLSRQFLSLFEWFIDRKLSIHLGNDKKKLFFFSQIKSPPKLGISNGDYSLKQHNTVEYFVWYLPSNLNREAMARRVIKKEKKYKNKFLMEAKQLFE